MFFVDGVVVPFDAFLSVDFPDVFFTKGNLCARTIGRCRSGHRENFETVVLSQVRCAKRFQSEEPVEDALQRPARTVTG